MNKTYNEKKTALGKLFRKKEEKHLPTSEEINQVFLAYCSLFKELCFGFLQPLIIIICTYGPQTSICWISLY